MRFGVLGPLEVVERGRRLPLGGRRHLEVLALLLVEPGRSVSLDRMVTELWGEEADERALASLYTHVSNLRRVLGKRRIVRDPFGYRLALLGADEVDSERFRRAALEARRIAGSDPSSAAAQFGAALALWRGRPFEDLEDVAALEPAAAGLDQLHAAVETERFEAILRSGETPDVGELEELVQRRSFDEHAWGLLMQALYRHGRQADALRTYRDARALLATELGIEPSPWLTRLEERIVLHDPALDPTPAATPSNLPTYLTTFVGRDPERAALTDALAEHRLVTLTGPGGVGKTRLAVEVASALAVRYPDGVWLVDLANVADEAGVGPAVATTVDATGGAGGSIAAAGAALSGRRCLVILDNCEHVLSAARNAAAALLAAGPSLVLLATSRTTLGLAGEHRVWLAGLPPGDPDAPGDAVALFLDRARAIRPDRAGDGRATAAVRAICQRLDGMPLALELAAAHSRALSPREIVNLLARRFAVLVDASRDREIHRSLEATVGWSYGLLPPRLRTAFATLGVFEGPFTADAARAILDPEGDTDPLTAIEQLVDASLVEIQERRDGSTAYRLLNTLRSYARDRLTESGAWSDVAARHDRYCADLCRALADTLLVRGRPEAMETIATAAEDLVAAWDRMLPSHAVDVLPIAWALGNHWIQRGGIAEGEERVRDLLARTADDTTFWRMFVLTIGAWLADRRGFGDTALAWSDEALVLAEATHDPLTVVVALNFGGQLRVERGEHRAAIGMLRRSLDELARGERDVGPISGIADGRAWARVSLAEAQRWEGNVAADFRDDLYEVRRYFADIGEPEGQLRANRVLVTLRDLPLEERQRLAGQMTDMAHARADGQSRYEAARAMAIVAWDAGDRESALAANRAAVRMAMAGGSLTDLGSGLLHAGVFAAADGSPQRAARLIGAGDRMCGTKPGPLRPDALDAAIDRMRRELGDDGYAEASRIGAALSPGEAASLVLAAHEVVARDPGASARGGVTTSTSRRSP